MQDIVKKIVFQTDKNGENKLLGCDQGVFENKQPVVLTNYWPNGHVYYRTTYDDVIKTKVQEWSEDGNVYKDHIYDEGVYKNTKTYNKGQAGYIEPELDMTIFDHYKQHLDKIPKEERLPKLTVINGKEHYIGGINNIIIKNDQFVKYNTKGLNKKLM